jgi:hypothetical protein
LECKKRDINTPEVGNALDLLEPHIQPAWLIPQYRMALDRDGDGEVDHKGQQQLFRATFPGHPRLSQRANRQENGYAGAEVPRDPRPASRTCTLLGMGPLGPIGRKRSVSPSLHAAIENLPLIASTSKGGLTLALVQVAVTIFVKLTLGGVAQSWGLLTNWGLLDGASRK